MIRYTGRFFALLALVVCLGATPAQGKALESFSYDDLQKLVAASKGKVVMVNFFAAWCPPCREEIPGLIRIYAQYGKDNLVLIGAALDEDEAALQEYMQQVGINYPVKKASPDLLGVARVRSIPHLLVFDGKGEVAANQAGLVSEKDLREFLDNLIGVK